MRLNSETFIDVEGNYLDMEFFGGSLIPNSKNTKITTAVILSLAILFSIMIVGSYTPSPSPLVFLQIIYSAHAQVDETFKTYKNPKFGLTLSYPSNWSVNELRKDPGVPANNSIVAIFKSPPQGQNDKYVENVIVNIQGPRSDIVSLEHYTQNSLRAFGNMSDTIKILNSSQDTVDGLPAHQLIYTSSAFPGLNLKKMQQFTVVNNNTAYVVTFSAEESQYDKNLPEIQKMVNSLNINKDTMKKVTEN